MAFSCLAGILGVIVVAWYGVAPDPGEHPTVEHRIAEAHVGDSGVGGDAMASSHGGKESAVATGNGVNGTSEKI